jgi:hypothetical protein
MYDHILIYVIVLLNSLCQQMLIWRQKTADGMRWMLCGLAVAIPVLITITMRFLVLSGTIHGCIAEQTQIELMITRAASALLVAGPWLVTIAAVLAARVQKRCSVASY